MHENSDFATNINEINVELSGNSQRYINECCESESHGRIDGFGACCCKHRGGVTVALWCLSSYFPNPYEAIDSRTIQPHTSPSAIPTSRSPEEWTYAKTLISKYYR
jgi:hypothetical protein